MYDQEEAISMDDGESYSPPTPTPQPRPAEAPAPQQAIDTGDEMRSGMPDVSADAPRLARMPVREGLKAMGSDFVGAKDQFAGEAAQRFGGEAARERVMNTAPGRGAKALVSYLMGNTDNPAMVQEAGRAVDPQGQMTESQRNLRAVAQTAETQGDEAAWKLAQANRAEYNAKQSFAYAAINGTQQKPPDLDAAVKAANQAQGNVLDGSDVTFSNAGNGSVVATIRDAAGEPRQVPLSIPAFKEFLNVGKTGMLDRLLDKGVPALLDQLSQQRGAQTSPQRRPQPLSSPQEKQQADAQLQDETAMQKTNFGKTPSTMNLSGNDRIQYGSNEMPENPTLEQRSQRMFPGITQGAQAEQWMAGERAREGEQKNRLDVANVKVDVAEANANARVKAAETAAGAARDVAAAKAAAWEKRDQRKLDMEDRKLTQRMQEMFSRNNNAQLQQQMANIRAKRMTMTPLDDQEKALYTKVMGMEPQSLEMDPQGQQGQAPQTRPAAQPSGNQSKAQSPRDQQALAWANANPNDPRAAKIKAQLGAQ